jgi:hypothetical protein
LENFLEVVQRLKAIIEAQEKLNIDTKKKQNDHRDLTD